MSTPRVAMLHVGGTIAMVPGDDGLVPADGFIRRYLSRMQELASGALPACDLHILPPLLDSADMKPADWVRIARAIAEHYDDYDGFVVIHGTDTMAYSASAVSFLLQGLAKPVVFTGAQLPLSDVRSDGREHLITSLLLAGTSKIPEVCLYFGGKLLRGNRAQKVHSASFFAFDSGNLAPLATVGVEVEVNRHLLRPPATGPVQVLPLVRHPEVVSARLYPGMTARLLRQILAEPVEGVVLETYGAGTFPSSDADLLDAVREAVARGVVVVNTSSVHAGRVRPSLYGTGAALTRAGVVSAGDMTPEATLAKLYCLLACGRDIDDVREALATNLAGELTPYPEV